MPRPVKKNKKNVEYDRIGRISLWDADKGPFAMTGNVRVKLVQLTEAIEGDEAIAKDNDGDDCIILSVTLFESDSANENAPSLSGSVSVKREV